MDPLALTPPSLEPDLAMIVSTWPNLPAAVKAGIVAMVKATGSRA